MNTRRCLKVADRMNTLLVQELQHSVDCERMLADPLYARDVLLVCDAFRGADLASLAQHFRVAAAEEPTSKDSGSSQGKAKTARDSEQRRRQRGAVSAPRTFGSWFGAAAPTPDTPEAEQDAPKRAARKK